MSVDKGLINELNNWLNTAHKVSPKAQTAGALPWPLSRASKPHELHQLAFVVALDVGLSSQIVSILV